MDVDPAASMRCWAVEIELGGRTFTVPALPAADWWPVLEEANLLGVLDLLPDGGQIDDMIMDDQISGKELEEVLTAAVEQAAGRSVHSAFLLAVVASMQWPVIGGELARRGFPWETASLGAALDAVYLTIVERLKEDALTKFETLLDDPTMGGTLGRRSKVNQKRALDNFEEIAGPKPPPVKSTGVPSEHGRPKTQPRRQNLRQGAR